MKNITILLAFVALCLNIKNTIGQDTLTAIDTHGKLQVEGTKIIGTNHGSPAQLRGMSMFWSQWGDGSKFYNEGTINTLVDDWKINIVRAAMGVSTDETDGYIHHPEIEKAKIQKVVEAAIAKGIYVIIDWHSHHAEDEEAEAKKFFAEMAQLYGHHPNVIYEVYNEPLNVSWSGVIKPYCEAVIDTIRTHDSDNLIICGTRNWCQEVEEVATNMIADTNVAYTLHFYAATHKESLRAKAQRAITKGVPLFVTEFGTCEASGNGVIDEYETRLWWDFLAENSISWCNWSVSNKLESASSLVPGSSSTGDWDESDYSTSGNLVRDELRRTYQLPVYNNNLSIQYKFIDQVLSPDTTFQFEFSVYLGDTLVDDSLVTYKLELTDGGAITDSALFTPNGETGAFRLLITAFYDTLVTTSAIPFNVSDVKQGELLNKTDKTFLALTLSNSYKLAPETIFPNKSKAVPLADSILSLDSQTYTWKIVNEPDGIFSQADSAVKSFLAIYVINPIARQAKISTANIGNSTMYVNGTATNTKDFPLLKGENILFIEYIGLVDSSAFDFAILTSEGDTMPYLSYSTVSNGFFDCNNTWYGEAYTDKCGCIGGTTGINGCPGPFNGDPFLIPGKIELEEYDYGKAGVTYYDVDAANQGMYQLRGSDGVDISFDGTNASIGWVSEGEWLKYSVNVNKPGRYVVDFNIASAQSTGSLMIKLDNKDIFNTPVKVPSTGSWTAWDMFTSDTTTIISSGEYTLQFLITGAAFNIDNMEFRLVEPVGFEDDILSTTDIFPNPFTNTFQLSVVEITTFKLYNTFGSLITQGSCNSDCNIGAEINQGIYILELQQNTKKAIKRIVKQ